MARQESEREDLMREAVALVERVELLCAGFAESITAGFRSAGELSLFFGQDPVYQFDGEFRLRRAYVAGHLYRSQGTTLARLTRERTPEETRLLRYDLQAEELALFQIQMREILSRFLMSLQPATTSVLRSVPEGSAVAQRTQAVLPQILARTDWLSRPLVRRRDS